MGEEPRGKCLGSLEHWDKAPALESPEKPKRKPTNKLTFLGVFQTYHPSTSKLTVDLVVCDFYFGRQLLRSIPSEEFGNKLDPEMQNASWILDGTDPALHIPDSFFELQNPFESRSLQIDGIDQNYLPDREEASKFSPPASQKGDGRRAKRQTSRLIGALRQSPGSPCALQLTTGSVVYGLFCA
uniref:AGC-kinase C-terminal domain-containing protein n=1 Tax=Heterorhabditis bacteriophora TaxID=37862 RepID=A0A1I7X7K1_HETBA